MVHRKLDGFTRTAAANRLPSGTCDASRCAYSIGGDRPDRMVELARGGQLIQADRAVAHSAAVACGAIRRVLPPLPTDRVTRPAACACRRCTPGSGCGTEAPCMVTGRPKLSPRVVIRGETAIDARSSVAQLLPCRRQSSVPQVLALQRPNAGRSQGSSPPTGSFCSRSTLASVESTAAGWTRTMTHSLEGSHLSPRLLPRCMALARLPPVRSLTEDRLVRPCPARERVTTMMLREEASTARWRL